jgi:hypothetical protein
MSQVARFKTGLNIGTYGCLNMAAAECRAMPVSYHPTAGFMSRRFRLGPLAICFIAIAIDKAVNQENNYGTGIS